MLLQRLVSLCRIALVSALVVVLTVALPGLAADLPPIHPEDNIWVRDQAEVLDQQTESTLNQRLTQFEARTSGEIAVVTVPEVQGDVSVRQSAIALFNRWGIGKASRDNGVLLLLSMGDRRVELVTGAGIDYVLTDAVAQEIIDTQMIPALQQDNPSAAVLAGTDAVIAVLTNPIPPWVRFTQVEVVSLVLLGVAGLYWLQLKLLERQAPKGFERLRKALNEGIRESWCQGVVADFRLQSKTQAEFVRKFTRIRARSFFFLAFAITHWLLASVGFYLPIATGIVFCLCFPLTLALKNWHRLGRLRVWHNMFRQLLPIAWFIGVLSTVILSGFRGVPVPWLATLIMAAIPSGINAVNWHRRMYLPTSSRKTLSGGSGTFIGGSYGADYGGSYSGGSSSSSSASSSSGSSDGGGSTDGSGAGGSW